MTTDFALSLPAMNSTSTISSLTDSGLDTVIVTPSGRFNDYDFQLKLGFTLVSVAFIVFSIIALLALLRTKRTPENSRFLSSGLIFHDTMAVVFFTVRKFCDSNTGHIVLHVFGVSFTYLAYITIGIMSLERLVVFHSPNFYLRNFTATKVKRWVCVLWLISAFIYYFTRYGACYLIVENATIYDVLGECNVTSFTLFGLTIIIVIILSLLCYAKIVLIVWNEVKKSERSKSLNISSTARSLKQYKSTTLVFVYLIAVILTGLAYVLIMLQGLDTKPLRLYLDAVNTCNCVVDPCLYVLWYRECRMEMLKMMSFLLPRLSGNVEKMRLNVFEVVTSRKFSRSFGRNRTEPLFVTSPDTAFSICEIGVSTSGK